MKKKINKIAFLYNYITVLNYFYIYKNYSNA